MTILIRLLLASLATYRLAQLIAYDSGPYGRIDRLRRFLGRRAAGGDPTWKTLADLAHCPFCLGVWLALALTPFVLWPAWASDLFLIWWGLAGAQSALQTLHPST